MQIIIFMQIMMHWFSLMEILMKKNLIFSTLEKSLSV